jgi:Ca2+-binding EF-hand superfamily protein
MMFDRFDRDGSGTIDATELSEVMRGLGKLMSPAELNRMLNEADIDGNGTIDFAEFVAIVAASERRARQMFETFDQNGSGTIEASELNEVMRALGLNLSAAELSRMAREADRNGNGTIDFPEFTAILEAFESRARRMFDDADAADGGALRALISSKHHSPSSSRWEKDSSPSANGGPSSGDGELSSSASWFSFVSSGSGTPGTSVTTPEPAQPANPLFCGEEQVFLSDASCPSEWEDEKGRPQNYDEWDTEPTCADDMHMLLVDLCAT